MPKIGAAWNKTDKNGNEYLSVSVDKALTPLIIDENKTLALFLNDKKENNEQPDYILCIDVKKAKEDTKTDFLFN